MADKVLNGINSTAQSCNSKRSAAGAVKVLHISNPTSLIVTSPSEFRAVVQSLTGRKRSSSSSGRYEEMKLCSHDQYRRQGKAPKLLEDDLQCLNDMKSSKSAVTDYKTNVRVCCNDRDPGDVRIFEEMGSLPTLEPDYIVSHQVRGTDETSGDTRHIFFDKFSPSVLFCDFEPW